MNNSNLNYARKWRSKNFDQIIGQDLCVRILRNALYLNTFFPVYIFSGQRGCGKTTTARVFAASINCKQLINFQQNPKDFSIPCLECISCKAVLQGNHPDFIEIDAASHTGVDNVRQIIEAASLLPLMGNKKIYLIDEAHMLSKAAFNAFLKILEEPPISVLFILATTDAQKIIDTVRSRSFQLFFTPVNNNVLISHLEAICAQEGIEFDIDGLNIIVKESEGSVRDAINILEQVRFSAKSITKDSVTTALGHLSDDCLLGIFEFIITTKDPKRFLQFLDEINFYTYSPDYIWISLLEIFKLAIRTKYNINLKNFENYQNKLNKILADISLSDLICLLNEFCKNEPFFLKTVNKHLFLELLFLRISLHENIIKHENIVNKDLISKEVLIQRPKENIIKEEEKVSNLWNKFILELEKDSLLSSIFTQANFVGFDEKAAEVKISFSKKSAFFKDLINDSKNAWSIILKKIFGDSASLIILFNENIEDKPVVKQNNNFQLRQDSNIKKQEYLSESKVDISDKNKWQTTHALLNQFSGTVNEIQEEIDE